MGAGGKSSAPSPTGFSAAAGQALGQGIDSRLGQINTQAGPGTGDEARQQAIDAAYGQAQSRLSPQWDQRESAQRTQMINQGLDPGSQAYDSQMGNLGRERNDAYTSAMASAIGQGTAAGHTAFMDNVTSNMLPYQQLGILSGISDSQYQNALQGYGADQAGKNSMMSGLGSLGGMAIGGPAGAYVGSKLGGGK
jgi:hypothetical protein